MPGQEARSDRFPAPPNEGGRGIDVIDSARRVIIPAIRQLTFAQENIVRIIGMDKAEEKAAATRKFVETARKELALPLWGALEKVELGEEDLTDDLLITGKEIGSRNERVLERSRNLILNNSVILGYEIVMNTAQSPRITDSLIVGRNVLYSSNNNNSEFSPEQLELMMRLAKGIKVGNKGAVRSCLSGLEELAIHDDMRVYGRAHGEEEELYVRNFDDLAGIASFVDNHYVHLLKGSEATDVMVDNSVIFASRALTRVLGGTIRNSIIASTGTPLSNAHVRIENSIIIGPSGEIHMDGKYGDPDLAKAVVDVVRELPSSPLLAI